MEDKKSGKSMPVAINIGAGSGIGGIVLLGGSLVTATVVSALSKRRRSPTENISKNPSQSPEIQTTDAPNELESLPLPLNLQKPSDEETNIEEIQNLTLDEKHDSGIDIADQEKTSICEEQVVMAANIESAPPSSDDDSVSEIRDDDGEEQINSMLINEEKNEHVDTKLSIEEQSMATNIIPEAEQGQVSLKDDKTEIEDDKIAIEKEDNAQFQFPEKEAIQAEIKNSVNDEDQKTVKGDNPQTRLMNKEEDKDTEEKLVKKDEIPDVKSIEKEEDSKKDSSTSKTELTNSDEQEEKGKMIKQQTSVPPKKRRSSITGILRNTLRKDSSTSKTEVTSPDESDDDEEEEETISKQQTGVPRLKRRSSITGKLKDTWKKINVF